MSTTEERIAVFHDTMSWIQTDPDLSDAVAKARAAAEVYFEDDYPSFVPVSNRRMNISVSKDRSFQAAIRLRIENPGAKIAVMNFANAFIAGGGVTSGASAQEECLCRTSTLYPVLNWQSIRDTFYRHHVALNTPKASDSLVYSENIIVCKTDEDLPRRMPKETWVKVDVITIAAPDLREYTGAYGGLVDGAVGMSGAELLGYHVKRAIHMLTCAAAKGADILVHGAFGCGAFRNDPNIVARAYQIALEAFPKVFDKIEFAVYCPPGQSRNYDVFSGTFAEKRKKLLF